MTKEHWFMAISIVLAIVAAIICFKNFRNFKRSVYWVLFPNIISVWSKKLWEKDCENSFRFEAYIILVSVLIGINYLVFKYLL